ncbi:unnamed protein product [Blepharisma stoltei]|uniref:Roadblock/LAMTOR2 domain-containing protein n=1 Tax=Blepharisma stoltei TaxID=1481888 RepID=A0AAU9J089_9CILI|nr:unnamed protein product [Blepharisma stoltei]
MKCFCLGKSKKKNDAMDEKLNQIKNLFEKGSLRMATFIQEDGKVLSLHNREDITGAEVDALLYQISSIKHQYRKIMAITGQTKSQPIHIQGKYIGISLYDLPNNSILALVIEVNSHFSELIEISSTQALIQAKIDEIFSTSTNLS